MLSNKDIRVENGNLIINGVKYPLDTIEIKEEVEALTQTVGDETGGLVKDVSDLTDRVEALETSLERFVVTLASAIGTPDAFTSDCFYNPITKEVTLNIMIESLNALIPANGTTIFTVPTKYRPSDTISLGMANLISSDGWDTKTVELERCFLTANGTCGMNPFIYGQKSTKLFYLNISYIAE